MRHLIRLALALTLLGSAVAPAPAQPAVQPVPAQPAATNPAATIQDTPTGLVGSGVTGYTLAAPKLFWNSRDCTPFIGLAAGDASKPSASLVDSESLFRIATYGGSIRKLYGASADGYCGALAQAISSNLAADANYIYWLNNQGMVRLSTSANPGDTPELVNALVGKSGEVADGGDKTFYADTSAKLVGSTYLYTNEIGYVLKSNNQRVALLTLTGNSPVGQLSTDGTYVYYVLNGTLYRLNPGVDNGVALRGGVSGYYAEGRLGFCTLTRCTFTNRVYIGSGPSVYVYNNLTDSLGAAIYTSSDASAQVFSLTTTGVFGSLFLFERRRVDCVNLFCSNRDVLLRTGRGGGTVDPLYNTDPPTTFSGIQHLTTDGTYLFWQDIGTIQKLAANAAALPNINMRVFTPNGIGNGMEITQGIQSLNNSVGLIRNRRTFVRVYAKSDSANIAGVTAQLIGSTGQTLLGTLSPVNPAGTSISVRGTPSRNDINQSFLFELPWSWTNNPTLRLTANINPYKAQLEPNYADNSVSSGTLAFKPSPTLSAEFYRLNYTVGGTTYKPRIDKDVLQTYSWIMRAYPIGGAIGTNFKPRLWDVAGGNQLGNWVTQTSGDCAGQGSLCASYYTNGWLKYYRDHGWVPNTSDFYYGMISDGAGFPRGQAIYGQTSVGPSGSGTWGWDTDGSYADWYAGHEIGHSLGRAHPSQGNSCGHSASDASYPYTGANIGASDGSLEGFDGGDAGFGIAKAVYPGTVWHDVMSYCNNQWISDYTYNGMYNYMIGHPSTAASTAASTRSANIAVSGDFLSVAGSINAAGTAASFSYVRRLTDVANQPPLVAGGYALKLLGATNNELASYSFTPTQDTEGTTLGFSQVVNFVAGTRTIQVVKGAAVLATLAVSANPPVISNVALQGAASPVSGVVTLGWTASDPDGGALTFDIFYSRDSGATFQPVTMGATGTSAQIDTAQLGGSGTAILRVVASDGVNTAETNSAPFVMAPKPPEPYVLTPADNTHVHYGQLVNFSGMAFDPQDGTVAETGLLWKDAGGNALGSGALISLDSLPVGSNKITLVATNSTGQSATKDVTVIVDDDLNLPGPTLTAGPGQVSWQVDSGATTAQTADISIGNSGSGALGWTATSDQPWLTLSAASGTVAADGDPSTLTITANPTGLAPNKPYSAKITLTKPEGSDGPAQTVVITINLNIGDVWNNYTPTQLAGNRTYLPLSFR